MDIKISDPIVIQLNIVEFLEVPNTQPTFRCEALVRINHPTGHFEYTTSDIWFFPDNWIAFSDALNTLGERKHVARLSDLSDWFTLEVSLADNERTACCAITTKDNIPMPLMNKTNMINFRYAADMNRDELAVFTRQFSESCDMLTV